jgi:hypothetical protein
MLLRVAPKIEGRRGSQQRLCEGGRYLGIPRNRGLAALREGSGCADDHGRVFLTAVQETGCGTTPALFSSASVNCTPTGLQLLKGVGANVIVTQHGFEMLL